MFDIHFIIQFFLKRIEMSPKKMQKLLYYAYAWTLALLNENVDHLEFRLFNDRIEAWVHGPVIPSIYREYKKYGWDIIPKDDHSELIHFPTDVQDVLNQVYDVYGGMTASELETITHREWPWIKARGNLAPYETSNNLLSDRDIFIFYNERAGV